MLRFTTHESLNSSHFFITTLQDNICMLNFTKLDQEEMFFQHDYLQENVFELTVAKATANKENCGKGLAPTIKSIFDTFLAEREETVVYVSMEENSSKYHLVTRYINNEVDPNYKMLLFKADNKAFFFFFNEHKTSTVEVIVGLTRYFKNEYGISFVNN